MDTSLEHIVIVGGGKMGEAILSGLLTSQSGVAQHLEAKNFCIVNPGDERRQYLEQTYGVASCSSVSSVKHADLIVLAVKPQVMNSVLNALSQQIWLSDSCAVSIAAGVALATLEAALPEKVRVLRVMPNTPLTVGCGMSVVCPGSRASEDDTQLILELFEAMGRAIVLDESHIDAVTALSGSGPAYVALLVEAMTNAGMAEGLCAEVAETLATSTVLGTAKLLEQSGQGAKQTRMDVCSPGGTTMAALDAMEKMGFSDSIMAGVRAAVKRAKELSQ